MTAKIVKGKGVRPSSKSVDLSEKTGGVIHKKVVDARAKADKIIKDAEADAKKIHEEAKGVLEDSKAKAKESIKRGHAAGESKGYATVSEKLIALESMKEKFFAEAEPEVVKLSMTIAEKVIGTLASENIELIKSVVHQALERTLGDRIVVRLNPEDYKKVVESGHDFKACIDKTKRLTVRQDEAINVGGCIVESEVGTIDAQLEPQLEAIRKALEI